MNLLKETIAVLANHAKGPKDVLWVGSYNGLISGTWDAFAAVADVEYDSGFGSQQIASDLTVVGDGWWIIRHEYDGSEGWEWVEPPVYNPEAAPLRKVDGGCWSRLAEIAQEPKNAEESDAE